jgi:hypothetical protein
MFSSLSFSVRTVVVSLEWPFTLLELGGCISSEGEDSGLEVEDSSLEEELVFDGVLSSVPGGLILLALELELLVSTDSEDSILLELDVFLLELDFVVVLSSAGSSAGAFSDELETALFLLEELFFACFFEELEELDFLDEELIFSIFFEELLEAFTSSSSAAGSSSKMESSTR